MAKASIVTVGSELVEGLRVDTNTSEIARAVATRGFTVREAVSVGDSLEVLADTLRRLVATDDLVIVTGGLGPTHDDLTREAASAAIGVPLHADARLLELLEPWVGRHRETQAAEQVRSQALVLEGARVLPPTTGTAAGQIVEVDGSILALLPGPPSEMRSMLEVLLGDFAPVKCDPVELGVVGLAESDAQLAASRALRGHPYVGLTVLAKPGDVRVILIDMGTSVEDLAAAREAVAGELGDYCYSTEGESLAEVVLRTARERGVTISTAESCTGGLVAAALTDIAGASDTFLGSAVTYANSAKTGVLGVPANLIERHGAVSEHVARAMAEGVRGVIGADVAVSVTGIAGPDGGSAEKPVGLVWFAVSTSEGTLSQRRYFRGGGRDSVRARATSTALDLLRRRISDPQA